MSSLIYWRKSYITKKNNKTALNQSVCLSVCLPVFTFLFTCLSVCMYVCLSPTSLSPTRRINICNKTNIIKKKYEKVENVDEFIVKFHTFQLHQIKLPMQHYIGTYIVRLARLYIQKQVTVVNNYLPLAAGRKTRPEKNRNRSWKYKNKYTDEMNIIIHRINNSILSFYHGQ